MANYDFKAIEDKWNSYWEKNKTFKTDVWDFSKPKFYSLSMFPYPSGEGLHVGHPVGYVATDAMARFKRMCGFNVLYPFGYDAFGLPAEQYAIKTGNNPMDFTMKNIDNFRKQLKMIGLSADWDREIATCEPEYYKWTQWIFEELYKAGYVKYQDMSVNWCEELGTVLANDEVIDGKSERGGYPVVKKFMRQWVIEIPKYAQKLLDGLKDLDWPESTKITEQNWIGRSEGAIIKFSVEKSDETFEVFTTRADTLFGATYCALAPEHEIVKKITTKEQKNAVENYIAECAKKTDIERCDTTKEKTGVFTGAYAINPANKKLLPIYIADYVLSTYGKGALMAVPAHDERDYAFAKKYGLDIIEVVKSPDGVGKSAYTGDGEHINSDFLNGLNNSEATEKMFNWLEKQKIGKKSVNYRLRDWIFARQHYWGEPMPIIHMEDGSMKLVDLKDLPLILPRINDYQPKNGQPPLNNAVDWVNVTVDGKKGKRETCTMPSSAGSSWYFLRYIDPHNDKAFADTKLLNHWMPVDLYVGGPEHNVGHVLYARMWNRFLCEQGYLTHPEPFKRLRHNGMMMASDGRKMSKRWKNVINPNDVVAQVGADVFRLYEMFMGPVNATRYWNDKDIVGLQRFLEKIWALYHSDKIKKSDDKKLEKIYHQTVKKVTNLYEELSLNTVISSLMEFLNAISSCEVFPVEYAEGFLQLLNPLAPFITEELWSTVLKHKESIAFSSWPKFDESKCVENEIELPVQVNGKLKGLIKIQKDSTQAQVLEVLNQQLPNIASLNVKKIVFVPNKILNIIS